MSRLKKLTPEVKYLLEKYPKLRDDDFLLIGAVYSINYNISQEASFLDVMKNHDSLGLPSFESVRRTRQKIQEEYPALRSSKAKQKQKQMAFNDYYDYAKGY